MRELAERGLGLNAMVEDALVQVREAAKRGEFKLLVGFTERYSWERLEELAQALEDLGFEVELYSDYGQSMLKVHW
jgi:hypothetical protein